MVRIDSTFLWVRLNHIRVWQKLKITYGPILIFSFSLWWRGRKTWVYLSTWVTLCLTSTIRPLKDQNWGKIRKLKVFLPLLTSEFCGFSSLFLFDARFICLYLSFRFWKSGKLQKLGLKIQCSRMKLANLDSLVTIDRQINPGKFQSRQFAE